MKLEKTPKNLFLLSLAGAAFFTLSEANAGVVKIINNSDDNIMVNVIPGVEGIPYCWKCFDSCLNSCGKSTAKIVVPVAAFGGCEYFSVIDISNGILGSGKCKNLSVFKNYEVSFYSTTFGTNCAIKEIL
ncbi:MAG: hypothetical protein BGO67_09240 [Alphaproteobacteria bacterium 41-28]|nr:MAG: hypothetical protein BGO67_09240 [Alphaproteobacteria bacterium 41-28]